MSLSVCIFARNEERLLPNCVGALNAAGLSHDDQVYILVNGCSDNTALAAKALASADRRITVIELPVGDKANAWNDYVHRIADLRVRTHVFIDGDTKPSDGSLFALCKALAYSPASYAAAAVPIAGRSRRKWTKNLLIKHQLSGNLYAMSSSAINAFRQKSLRLPFGAKGEDGLVAYLLLTNLKGGKDDSFNERIIAAEHATFEFGSLNLNFRDLKIYQRRLQRYSERYFQKQILYKLLKDYGVAAMPDTVYTIYTPETLKRLHPRLDLVNFWFDIATLRRLKRLSNTQTLQPA